MYLYRVYTYKSSFFSLLAPQAIFFVAFVRYFEAILQLKMMISKGKGETQPDFFLRAEYQIVAKQEINFS